MQLSFLHESGIGDLDDKDHFAKDRIYCRQCGVENPKFGIACSEKHLLQTALDEAVDDYGRAGAILQYAGYVIGGRWPEGEKILLKLNNFEVLYQYSTDIIKGRWPEAEPILRQWQAWWQPYRLTHGIK